MLSVIRRIVNSRIGLVVTFALLAIIAVAFAAGDINGTGSGKALSGDAVATVGATKITGANLQRATEDELSAIQQQQQQPGLDMAQFAARGGVDLALDKSIVDTALEQFGRREGVVVSKKLVDTQIASMAALQGPNGKFSEIAYRQALQQARMTDAMARANIARQLIKQLLVLPVVRTRFVPQQLALPYASLLLERREGEVGFVPTVAMGNGSPPTDAEVNGWYRRNIARYTLGERRVIRYAIVTGDQIKGRTVPSEQELVAAYKSQSARYAPSEKRTFVQVIVADQAAADALAAKVRAGTAIDAAARAAGLEPLTLTGIDKAGYAGQSSPAAADAVFGAASGAVIGPVRGAIGFVVARLDKIEQVPGKTPAQARSELIAAVARDKTQQVLGRIHDAIDDDIGRSATFDEVVADQKLAARNTPALLATGIDPDNATVKAAPDFAPVIAAAFQAEEGDAPQMVQIDAAGGFAVVGLGRILAPAARPLMRIRDAVARDFALDRANRAARGIAAGIVARASGDTPLATLFSAGGVKAPPVRPLKASRAQLAADARGVPPPVALMFSMSERTAKLLEAPNNAGWFVVRLARIDRGNAAGQPQVIAARRGELARTIGEEHAEQFAKAISQLLGVRRNDKAIALVKASLTGQGSADRP